MGKGLASSEPLDPRDAVRAGYDEIAAAWSADRAARPKPEAVRLLDQLVVSLPQGSVVVDAGCGAGAPVTRALAGAFDVLGVDVSPAMIARARQAVPGAEFHVADMTSFELPPEAVDAVVSYYAVIHVPREEHAALFRRFHTWIRPGGLALLCLGRGDLPSEVDDDFFGVSMYWSHFDGPTNVRLLIDAGFEIVDKEEEADPLGTGSHLFVLARRL